MVGAHEEHGTNTEWNALHGYQLQKSVVIIAVSVD